MNATAPALAGILEDFRRIWKMAPSDAKQCVFDNALRFVRNHFRFEWSSHQLEQELLAMFFVTNHLLASSETVLAEIGEAWEREAQFSACQPRPPISRRFQFREARR